MIVFKVTITDDREHDLDYLLMRIFDGVSSLVGRKNVLVTVAANEEADA